MTPPLADSALDALERARQAQERFDRRTDVQLRLSCEHEAHEFTCDRAKGHKGLHAQRDQLRDGTQTTNWGDDGLALWATKDTKRLREHGVR